MKIVIGSLQVSQEGSKGHFNPAVKLAMAAKHRGHEPIIFPLPCALSDGEQAYVKSIGIGAIDPPPAASWLKSKEELAHLAKHPELSWQAYYSFLVMPLLKQFIDVEEMLKNIAPDAVIYDMLSWCLSLAARRLGIVDVGFCAGLKLVAPEQFLSSYKSYKTNLDPDLNKFLYEQGLSAKFRHVELLSKFGNLVFTPPSFIKDLSHAPAHTHLVGPLPISAQKTHKACKEFAILSLGSVFDAADFPDILDAVIESSRHYKLDLIVTSKKLSEGPKCLPDHVKAFAYLPLSKLLPAASVIVHHGGANSFSEALMSGVPQIIIPLSNDQPIQAHYLQAAGMPLVIEPHQVTIQKISSMLEVILLKKHPLHDTIAALAQEFSRINGADNAIAFVESVVRS